MEKISVSTKWVTDNRIVEGSYVLDRNGTPREVVHIEARHHVGGENHMKVAYYRLYLD